MIDEQYSAAVTEKYFPLSESVLMLDMSTKGVEIFEKDITLSNLNTD